MHTPSSPSFKEIGLPDGHAFPELAYHCPTGTVIAHTRPRESRLPSHRLSMRLVKDSRYSPIGDFSPAISVSSFAVCPTLPLLYFITSTWSEHENGPPGGCWEALYRFTLDTRESEVIARRGDLIAPEGYQSAWLSELLSVSGDGGTLFCKAALCSNGRPIDYCLSELVVAERKLTAITKLEAVFA
jgi:hypothetical protein